MEGDNKYSDYIKAIQLFAENVVNSCNMILKCEEGEAKYDVDVIMDMLFSDIDHMTILMQTMSEDE